MLLEADSPYHTAPLTVILAGVARVLPQLLKAYRSGGGVPYAAYGPHLRRGIAALNRPMFHELASSWLPAVPALDRRLRSAPPARVLDLGCGLGASSIASEAPFDLVTIFEALHDMGDPVGTLQAARALLAADGQVLVADERVADAFATPGDPVERFMYGWSVLHCLPATLAERPVEATGTVLRAPTVERWAAAAGFTGFEVLPIDNPFWRFYRMHG